MSGSIQPMILLSSSAFRFKEHEVRGLCLAFVFGDFDGVGGVSASLVGQDIESVVYNRQEYRVVEPNLIVLGLRRTPGIADMGLYAAEG